MKHLLDFKYFVLFLLVMICFSGSAKLIMNGNLSGTIMLHFMALLCFFTIVHLAYMKGRASTQDNDQDYYDDF